MHGAAIRRWATGVAGGMTMLTLACAPVAAEQAARESDGEASAQTSAAAEAGDRLDLTGFDRITAGGIYMLDIEVRPAFSVELTGSPHMLERSRARVVDGVLELDHEPELHCRREEDCEAVRARIMLPALNGLSISGVSEGSRVTGIDAARFAFAITGVGEVMLSGRCDALDLDVSGVGDVDASALRCADVEADIGGLGDVEVHASRSIDADVGVGDLIVHGSPAQVVRDAGMLGQITIR